MPCLSHKFVPILSFNGSTFLINFMAGLIRCFTRKKGNKNHEDVNRLTLSIFLDNDFFGGYCSFSAGFQLHINNPMGKTV